MRDKRAGRAWKSSHQTPLSTVHSSERARLREIEEQISDLAGALRLRLNANMTNRQYANPSSNYKISFRIVPQDADKAASIVSLPSLYRTNEVQQSPSITVSTAHEWTVTCKIGRPKSARYSFDQPDCWIQEECDSEAWQFSSTESFLPMEPGASLVADVSLSAKYPFLTVLFSGKLNGTPDWDQYLVELDVIQ